MTNKRGAGAQEKIYQYDVKFDEILPNILDLDVEGGDMISSDGLILRSRGKWLKDIRDDLKLKQKERERVSNKLSRRITDNYNYTFYHTLIEKINLSSLKSLI